MKKIYRRYISIHLEKITYKSINFSQTTLATASNINFQFNLLTIDMCAHLVFTPSTNNINIKLPK